MIALHLEFNEDGATPHEIDFATRRLREELLRLNVDYVQRVASSDQHKGAKGTAISIGQLTLGIAQSASLTALATGVCQVLRAWVNRGSGRRVVIKDGKHTLELTGGSKQQHQQLIDFFISELSKKVDGEIVATEKPHKSKGRATSKIIEGK
jgi:hypothetical protein